MKEVFIDDEILCVPRPELTKRGEKVISFGLKYF
jgi:hypothetical protein